MACFHVHDHFLLHQIILYSSIFVKKKMGKEKIYLISNRITDTFCILDKTNIDKINLI